MAKQSKKQDEAKPKKPEKVSRAELSRRIAETAGMLPDEIVKLLKSLAEIEPGIKIAHRKPGSSGKRLFGFLKEKTTGVVDALQHAREEVEKREEIERKLRKKHLPAGNRSDLKDDDSPKQVSPVDISRAIEGARKYFTGLEEKKQADPVSERKADLVLRIIQKLKREEMRRLAKRIAMKQKLMYDMLLERNDGEYVPLERKLSPEEAEAALEKAQNELTGFGKGLHTLIDDAKEVVENDYDAAANVVRQWVGHQHKEE